MRKKTFIVVIVLALLTAVLLQAQQNQSDTELWAYIQRQSPIWYDSYCAANVPVNPGEWTEPIESAFLRLANNSGEKDFSIYYTVVDREDFNAMCFPGGQFVIHAGALAVFDMMIAAGEGQSIDRISAERLRMLREAYLAPVIAHELGHYYNRHTFRSMKMQWSLSEMSRTDLDLTQLRFSQENEFEADETGFLLLQLAGYNPSSMLMILEFLNAMQQDQLAGAQGMWLNGYLSTHPSPHKRYAVLEEDPEGLHQWAADLEQAFSDVQLGMNLNMAIETLDKGLQRAPGNLHLEKARAVALHKQWLTTTTLAQQKLKGLIDMPSFRDEMVFSKRGTRGTRKAIPGDRRLYAKAKSAYEDCYERAADPGFDSNFALVLAYSPDRDDEQLAINLASGAVNACATVSNISNLGVVLYLIGSEDEALELFAGLATMIDGNFQSNLAAAVSDPMVADSMAQLYQHMERVRTLDPDFVYGDFVPLLNFALCLAEDGMEDDAEGPAGVYLNDYESGSDWAIYLADQVGLVISEPEEKEYLEVNGIHLIDPITTLVDRWGTASEIARYQDGDEDWFYIDQQTKITIRGGIVVQIELMSPDSPTAGNLFRVGSDREKIESVLGTHKRLSIPYFVYEGPQNAAVFYIDDIAQSLILFP